MLTHLCKIEYIDCLEYTMLKSRKAFESFVLSYFKTETYTKKVDHFCFFEFFFDADFVKICDQK